MMKPWQKEHGFDYDIPAAVEFLVDKKVLEDVSWHNDTAPSFHIADPNQDNYGIRLWVDHPFSGNRDRDEGHRFAVQLGEFSGESDDEIETSELQDALTRLFKYALDSKFDGTEIRSQPWWEEGLDPSELFSAFKDYYAEEMERLRKTGKRWRPEA